MDIPSDTEEFLPLHHRERPDGERHWYGNSTEQTSTALQRVVHLAKRIIGALPCLKDIYTRRGKTKARSIVKDLNHPDNDLFSLLWLGRRYWIHQASTERLRKSFYFQAVSTFRIPVA